jgi:iron complex outermembrane receptor protein
MASANFYDIQRVEVLKGPQGTLYGRNATGGAINIITNKPGKEFAGGVNLELGDYDLFKANGFVNVPVSDSFALRLAAQRTQRNGYLDDGYNDEESNSVRLSALFDPSESFSVLLTGSYLHLGGKGPVHVPKNRSGFMTTITMAD